MNLSTEIKNNKITMGELLYYGMILCFMGSKAVGLTEGQWPLTVALIVGFSLFLIKLLITEFNIIEWISNIALIALGLAIYHINGHLELIAAVALMIGIKNVPLERTIKVALSVWGILFCITVVRALLGIYPGYIGTQTKFGFSAGIIRYSLGFTHPNVLHITYLIIVLMILYLFKGERKKLYAVSSLLFIGNMYIFLYSVSYTGVLVVTVCLALNLIFDGNHKYNKFLFIMSVLLIIIAFALPIIGYFILSDQALTFVNRFVNQRIEMAGRVFEKYGITLLGQNADIHKDGLNLDSSFAYILYYHGAIAYFGYLVAYVATLLNMIKNKNHKGISLLIGIGLAGITEQFAGNLSFKNISLLFLGDYIYNVLFSKVSTEKYKFSIIKKSFKAYNIDWLKKARKGLENYFKDTNWLKCLLPATITALIGLLIFNILWTEPLGVYKVVDDPTIEVPFAYENIEELDLDNHIIIGDFEPGCLITSLGWVDTCFETIRGRLSAIVWGFILGFVLAAYISNVRKLRKVYIEDPITKGNPEYVKFPNCNILGTHIAVTNMSDTVSFIKANLDYIRGKYICVSNVHTTVTAFTDKDYNNIQNGAFCALPDGKPLSYVQRKRGYIQADRVAGPDLMTEIFKISKEKGYRHFFFGSTNDTLKALRNELENTYPGINIVGTYSPKYYKDIDDVPQEEDEEHIRIINEAKPDFIWVGLGAPKQEIWMAKHEGDFNGVMLGVGAGFDFHAKTVKRAPKLFQVLYLEWLYRLLQDPKRLLKRYISTNFKFIKEVYKEGIQIKKDNKNPGVGSKKRLLIYAHYYAPDVASTGQILTELAEGLLDSMEVTVIAVVPSYSGVIEEKYKKYRFYRQDVRGVKVLRVRVPEFTKANKLSRAGNILSYYFRARKVTKKVGPQDYVLAISQPPILGGMLGLYGKKVLNAKFIYNIQDFNPEQIKSVSYSKSKMLINFMQGIDNNTCKKADLIITVGRDLVDTLIGRFKGKDVPRYVMINNWIDEKKICPLPVTDGGIQAFKDRYDLNNKFIFMYSGNIGLYYDLDNIIKVIERISPDTNSADGRKVEFVFVGNGGKKADIEKYVTDHKLENVKFIPYQEKEELNYSLNAADVHICVNSKGIKGVSCPSKYYGIAAAGKPVLASLESGSEIRCIIEETQGGLVTDPEDYEGFYRNIRHFIDIAGSEELVNMGINSRNNLVNNLTKDISIEKYKKAILEI